VTVAERREREREERRTQILDAAQQVFYDREFALVTMDEVAEAAQLGKGTLYNYFRTKEDLFGGVAARHLERMVEKYQRAGELASDGLDQVRRMLLAYADHMSTPLAHLRMAMARFLQGPPADPDSPNGRMMRDTIMQLIGLYSQAIERGQRDGSIREDLEPAPLCIKLWSCVNGALLFRLQLSSDMPPPQLRAIAPTMDDTVELLLDAIARRDASEVSREASSEVSELS
jgi:TetR/AcrR family transcriptional regulator